MNSLKIKQQELLAIKPVLTGAYGGRRYTRHRRARIVRRRRTVRPRR